MLSLLDEKHPMLPQMVVRQSEFQSVSCRRKKSLTGFYRGHFQAFSKQQKRSLKTSKSFFFHAFQNCWELAISLLPIVYVCCSIHCVVSRQTRKPHHQCESTKPKPYTHHHICKQPWAKSITSPFGHISFPNGNTYES